jgi:hypothetical protein
MTPQNETPTGGEPAGVGNNTIHGAIVGSVRGEEITQDASRIKRFATLQARCALVGGFVLLRLADGGLIASSAFLTRVFASLDEVEKWLLTVEAR